MRNTTRMRVLAATLVAAVVLGVGAGEAQASSVTVTSASKAVRAGKTGKLSLRLSAPSSMSCELSLARFGAARKNGKRSSRQITVERSRLGWSWRVPSTSRSGRVRVSASCSDDESGSSKTVVRRFRIIGKRAGTNPPGRTLRGRPSGSLLKASSGLENDTTVTPGLGDDTTVTPPARPTSGQCTVWARYKRPDIEAFGNASNWANSARQQGFMVDALPRVGDIAMWDANENGAGELGHVAYVEEFYVDGTIRVSEFNWAVREGYGERRIAPAGLDFIHKK